MAARAITRRVTVGCHPTGGLPPLIRCHSGCHEMANLSRFVPTCQRLTAKLCFFSQSLRRQDLSLVQHAWKTTSDRGATKSEYVPTYSSDRAASTCCVTTCAKQEALGRVSKCLQS